MFSSRRHFIQSAAASASLIAAPPFARRLRAEEVLSSKLASDPLRPQFHLLPARNWMNDPNGPIFWRGLYHMFFQYNPSAALWGDMHWGHAVSRDMIHWRHLPAALAPTPGWADADGCFTGSAVDDDGTATLIYTGVQEVSFARATLRDSHHNFRETQCLATSADPNLLTWTKAKDPILQPPDDENLTGFRDPFLWRDDSAGLWYLGIGSGQKRIGGRVLLYRSRDLRAWEYLHPLASGRWREKLNTDPVDAGEMWECPDFFPLGNKHVLLYSTAGQVMWEVGDLDPKDLIFHPQTRGVVDHGAYYAQKTQLDADGNRILWGWIPERRPDSKLVAAGWAGCMALPRTLSISEDGQLAMAFSSQVNSLRERALVPSPRDQSPDRARAFADVTVEDLRGEFEWRCGEEPNTAIIEDKTGPWLTIAVAPSGPSAAMVSVNGQKIEVPYARQERGIGFRLILDASVAELICNGRHAITARIYRQPAGPLRIRPEGPRASITTFQAYQLGRISNDRLTT
jgi:beta-fructofuranosidase